MPESAPRDAPPPLGLSERGRAQASEAAAALAAEAHGAVRMLYAPSVRARLTAEVLAEQLGTTARVDAPQAGPSNRCQCDSVPSGFTGGTAGPCCRCGWGSTPCKGGWQRCHCGGLPETMVSTAARGTKARGGP